MNRKGIQTEMLHTARKNLLLRLVLLLPVVWQLSACTTFTSAPLLESSSSSMNYAVVPPKERVDLSCEECVVEYVDVDVPECIQPVTTIVHRPDCKVCGDFSVSMRSQAGPGRCSTGEES